MSAPGVVVLVIGTIWVLVGIVIVIAIQGRRPKFRIEDLGIVLGWPFALGLAWTKGRWRRKAS